MAIIATFSPTPQVSFKSVPHFSRRVQTPPLVKIVRSIAAIRRFVRNAPLPLVLVPTMGSLHAGHAALIGRARRIAGTRGTVVTSIFVNPTQFGPSEDFSRYPRTFDEDRALCAAHGADAIFHPSAAEMYPADFSTWVKEERVSAPLCGASRPEHFRGVCTVVLKLFTIVEPTVAIFGLKDYQQFTVILRMVRDLNLPVRIVGAPTVRERDGLALSSRNRYLDSEERAQAPVLRRALLAAAAAFRAGEKNAARLRHRMLAEIATAPLARVDYAEVRDSETLEEVSAVTKRCVIAVAVFFGKTRLIDNALIGAPR
jgi:pantoate--beta-alanine ligase